MLANIQNAKKAFLVNLSDDGKINVLGQIPTQNGLFGDMSNKSLDSVSNDSDKKMIFKAKRDLVNLSPKRRHGKKNKSPKLVNLSPKKRHGKKGKSVQNLVAKKNSVSPPSVQNLRSISPKSKPSKKSVSP
jgi:hypothetical protein